MICIVFGLSILSGIFYIRWFYSSITENAEKTIIEEINEVYTIRNIKDDRIDNQLNENMNIREVDITLDNEECIAILNIESCDIRTIVTNGVNEEQLKYSVGHFPDSPMPHEGGNFALAGHSSVIYKQVLNSIKDINIGDEILISTKEGVYKYFTTEIIVVPPTATYVVNNSKKDKITIVTCTDAGKKRLVVVGEASNEKIKNNSTVDMKVELGKSGVQSLIVNFFMKYLSGYKIIEPVKLLEPRTITINGYFTKEISKKVRGSQLNNPSLFDKLGRDRYINVIKSN